MALQTTDAPTCASFLVNSNVPANVVQKPLGYLNSSITMDIYTHRAPEVEGKAAKVLGNMFSLVVSEGPEPLPPLTLIFEIFPAKSYKKRADERTRTADLPSLRVISQVLLGCAWACKSPISKRFSFF